MTLTEGFVRDEIFIDFGSEIMYGDDQCYIDYPCRFPTVGFQLMATNGLSRIADRIRKDRGFKPMHAMDEYTDDTCDNEGWYDFFIGLNGFADNHMDSCIDFVVVGEGFNQCGFGHCGYLLVVFPCLSITLRGLKVNGYLRRIGLLIFV